MGISTNDIPDLNSMLALGYQVRAFFWEKGVMRDLGTLGTGTDAQAVLINERGQVVGWSYTNSEPSEICSAVYGFPVSTGSFVWEKTKGIVDIGGFGGSCTIATDLNDRGEVVGQSWSDGDVVGHAFRWDAKTGVKDLGTLGGDFSSAHAINNNGIAVGGSYLAGNFQTEAALWSRETVTDLGAVDSDRCSYALGINGTGQVVGISAGSTDCDSPRAFLWEPGGSMVDLNSLVSPGAGIHVAIASTINDRGEIGGLGVLPDGETHAVLLVPCSNDRSACTEDVLRNGTTPSGVSVQQRSGQPATNGNSVRRMLRARIGLASQLPKANGVKR